MRKNNHINRASLLSYSCCLWIFSFLFGAPRKWKYKSDIWSIMQHAVDVHKIKSIFIQQQEWKIVPHIQAQIFFCRCCLSIPTIVSHTHIVTLCYVYFHYAGMAFLQLNKAKKIVLFFHPDRQFTIKSQTFDIVFYTIFKTPGFCACLLFNFFFNLISQCALYLHQYYISIVCRWSPTSAQNKKGTKWSFMTFQTI